MKLKVFNIIFKSLILIFGIISILLGFERIEISGVATNPVDIFYFNYYFGITYSPARYDGAGYGISYNNLIYVFFLIIYLIGFLLNFGYYKKQELSRSRKNLFFISIVLLGIGLFGCIFSPILTILIIEIPPTEITSFSFRFFLLIGFYMAIIVIILVLMEYLLFEKIRFFRRKIT
ncbi:MAG: hypothetical protein ACFFD5_02990 [Candidatus Thorarchaeota archaeon]